MTDTKWVHLLSDELFYKKLVRQCQLYVHHPEDAIELAQDARIKAWEKRAVYRPEVASVETWVCIIARRISIDFLRQKKRRPESSFDEAFMLATAENDDIHLQNIAVAECMSRLTPLQREVFWYKEVWQFTFKEISQIMGLTSDQVIYQYKLAKQSLQACLQSKGVEGE
jgi:RNA polymerase sigma-70 factor, ECF subfamily